MTPNPNVAFDKDSYLSKAPPSHRPFLEQAVKSQMFSVLTTEHLDDCTHDHYMNFFDQCELRVRDGRSASANDDYVTLPTPLLQELKEAKRAAASPPTVRPPQPPPSTELIPAAHKPDELSDVHQMLTDHLQDQIDGKYVVVPGPGVSHDDDDGTGPAEFTYKNGWPSTLSDILFTVPQDAIPSKVSELQRTAAPGLLQGSAMSLIRSEDEIRIVEGQRDPAALMAVEVYAMYCIATPAIIEKEPHFAVNHVLRALGILQDLEDAGLLNQIDEARWRAVINSCGLVGGWSMREIATSAFKTMQRFGIVPNAVAYGQCMKTFRDNGLSVSKDYRTPDSCGRKSFTRLEDQGWSWCRSKCPSLGGGVEYIGGKREERKSGEGRERNSSWFGMLNGGHGSSPNGTAAGPFDDGAEESKTEVTIDSPLREWVEAHHPAFLAEHGGASIASMLGTFFAGDTSASPSDPAATENEDQDSPTESESLEARAFRAGVKFKRIAIWNQCFCPNCEYVTLDEEIMALWDVRFDTEENLGIACPRCRLPWFPQLHHLKTSSQAKSGLFGQLSGLWSRIECDPPGKDTSMTKRQPGSDKSLNDKFIDDSMDPPSSIYLRLV